jgi:hypothetical protein
VGAGASRWRPVPPKERALGVTGQAARERRSELSPMRAGISSRRLNPPRAGPHSRRGGPQWVRQGESGLGTMLQYVLIWRERNVDASIVLTGRVGVVSAADVAPLARRQETRIRAALR